MTLCSILLAVIVAVSFSSAGAVTIDHDKVQPFPQPEPTTASEKAAVIFKPSLETFGTCSPYAAVNAAGETSGGLKGSGKHDSECKGSSLGSQVYGRAVWHSGLYAIMYSWYFPKDIYYGLIFRKGHRHNWVNTVVWIDNPAQEKPNVVAVATSVVTGGYAIKRNGPPECGRRICDPPFADYFDGTSPKLMYIPNKFDGSLLLLSSGQPGARQDLIMWEQMTDEARTALSETNFGKKAKVPFVDANFMANLDAARPFL